MSESALAAFASSVSSDPQLRQKLDAATGLDERRGNRPDPWPQLQQGHPAAGPCQRRGRRTRSTLEGLNSWGDALMHCFGASDND